MRLFAFSLWLMTSGCAQLAGLDDFEDPVMGGGPSTGGSGGATASAGGGGAGADGGSGGQGGCSVFDDNDSTNCGACRFGTPAGVNCAGGACEQGVCGAVSVVTSTTAGDVLFQDGNIHLVATGSITRMQFSPVSPAGGADAWTTFGGELLSGPGTLANGPDYLLYFAKTVSTASPSVALCKQLGCGEAYYPLDGGAGWVGGFMDTTMSFVLVSSSPDNQLYQGTIEQKALGVSLTASSSTFAALGLDSVTSITFDPFAAPNDAFFVGTERCIYRGLLPLATLQSDIPCFTDEISVEDVFATENRLFAANAMKVWEVDRRTGSTRAETSGRSPVTADGRFIFSARQGGDGVQVLNNDLSPVLDIPTPPASPIAAIDAQHPNFVFFSAGGSLYQWRKPPE